MNLWGSDFEDCSLLKDSWGCIFVSVSMNMQKSLCIFVIRANKCRNHFVYSPVSLYLIKLLVSSQIRIVPSRLEEAYNFILWQLVKPVIVSVWSSSGW